MILTPMLMVQEMCREFALDFNRHQIKMKPAKLIYDEDWKESKEDIKRVIKEILNVLKDIWNNSAFSSELAKTLNEGTYQLIVIVSAIRALLKNLPIGDSFISTSEKQSIASANRKGEGYMRRHLDIMLVVKYLETVFELMYVECSRLICTPQKKTDDEIKLWQETNDRLYWIHQSLKPDKDQFGIV
ncbi:5566_t:CDS:1, partial [Ambispora leptoticha]